MAYPPGISDETSRWTHIWVPAHELDNAFIKVASISKEATGNIIGILQPFKDGIIYHRDLAPFPQLLLLGLVGSMSVLNPAVVIACSLLSDVLLKDNHVEIRNLLCI